MYATYAREVNQRKSSCRCVYFFMVSCRQAPDGSGSVKKNKTEKSNIKQERKGYETSHGRNGQLIFSTGENNACCNGCYFIDPFLDWSFQNKSRFPSDTNCMRIYGLEQGSVSVVKKISESLVEYQNVEMRVPTHHSWTNYINITHTNAYTHLSVNFQSCFGL